jgi:hypothetical protein
LTFAAAVRAESEVFVLALSVVDAAPATESDPTTSAIAIAAA